MNLMVLLGSSRFTAKIGCASQTATGSNAVLSFFRLHLNLVLHQQALQLGKVFLRHACPQPALPVHFLFQNFCPGALAVVIEGAHLGVVGGGAEDDLGNQCFQFGRLQGGAGAFFISFDETAGAKQNPAEVAYYDRQGIAHVKGQ